MSRQGKKGSWSVLLSLVLTASIAVSGCGGGGGGGSDGGGSATSLQLAGKVSIVDPQQTVNPKPLMMGKVSLAPANVPANSDYNNDETEVYVQERSAEAFNTINEILCMLVQSKYDDMLNKGAYKALVDGNQCSSDRDDADSAGEESTDTSSGSTAPDYETWVVNSTRADNNSPQIVNVWINEEARQEGDHSEPAKVISAKVTITEGVSATNPYGLFELYFKANPVVAGVVDTNTVMFKGYLKAVPESGKVLLKFAMNGGFGTDVMVEKSVLDRAADGSGSGSTFRSYSSANWKENGSYNIAFNDSNFRRKDTTDDSEVCLDRTAFEETAWRYGLYNSTTGARLERNSGFSIKYNDSYGWIGYWGLWLPDGVNPSDGATVTKQVYSSGSSTETPYTLIKKGGKLKKHTQSKITLNDIKNIPLDWWDSGTSYRVIWNGTTFRKTAWLDNTNNSYLWTNYADDPQYDLILTALQWSELNFWSQALSGQVRVNLNKRQGDPNSYCTYAPGPPNTFSCTPDATTEVVFYAEDIVYPDDANNPVPSTLRCYDNCPQYRADVGGINPDVNFGNYSSNWPQTEHDYTFNATFTNTTSMVLKDNGKPVTWPSGLQSNTNQWGAMSGPLFDPSSVNLALLACDDWNGDTIPNEGTCGWKAWSVLPEFYTWETGPNQWNQFTALQGVKFDPPLQVAFTYPSTATGVNSAATDAKYSGGKFYLEYSGFGQLWGIPGKCIDMDTGVSATCGPNTRWVPEFTIPEGSTVSDGNSYLVKPLEKEQRMTSIDINTCLVPPPTNYPLPVLDGTTWTDPDIGLQPAAAFTSAPAVIGGVVQ